jgi:ABC-type antimicrobial peptide transport system permease subunit
MGLVGGGLGVALGLLLRLISVTALNAVLGRSLVFTIPLVEVSAALGVALVAFQVAALPPALRLARLDVLDAIHQA